MALGVGAVVAGIVFARPLTWIGLQGSGGSGGGASVAAPSSSDATNGLNVGGPRPGSGSGGVSPGASGTGSPGPSSHPQPTVGSGVQTCSLSFCVGGQTLEIDGASVYNPGLRPEQSGYLNPAGTIQLAQDAHLNTIRIINFYSDSADPNVEPFTESNWVLVDRMIAAAGAAGMHVDLGLGDYRNIL
ncbi:MAG: hypothetical protein JOY68_08365, partial [Candidatus Dormibacteraeota bacterium]|nr:hypothetical protein [Candidatus Dormibacteraeota bacterium]